MAKIKRIWNISPGILGLPNGTEIGPGENAPIPAEFAENDGIQSWVKDGLAATEEPKRVAVSVTAEAALAEVDTLKQERDAANAAADVARAEASAARTACEAALAEVGRLKAELAAATQPKT